MRKLSFLPAALFSIFLSHPIVASADTIGEVSDAVCRRMEARNVRSADSPVPCSRLRIIKFDYLGFDGKTHHDGEIMMLDAAAEAVRDLFAELLQRRFPIARARLMDHYDGDDAASMHDNNSSGFNHRAITGSAALSLHAYGLAIDINPVQNPYIALEGNDKVRVRPASGTAYLNRASQRPGKVARRGLAEEAVPVFARHGFPVWGGDWDSPIDYQHFQVGRPLAERLLSLPPAQAREAFRLHIRRYRECMAAARSNPAACRAAD